MAKKDEKVYLNIGKNWSVTNVRELDFGTYFTLAIDGAYFYDLRVVSASKNYDEFIACPEKKGKDGNYYKLYNIYLSPEDVEAIIDAIAEELEKQSKKAAKGNRK